MPSDLTQFDSGLLLYGAPVGFLELWSPGSAGRSLEQLNTPEVTMVITMPWRVSGPIEDASRVTGIQYTHLNKDVVKRECKDQRGCSSLELFQTVSAMRRVLGCS